MGVKPLFDGHSAVAIADALRRADVTGYTRADHTDNWATRLGERAWRRAPRRADRCRADLTVLAVDP